MINKVGIVCCSNGQKIEYKSDIDKLATVLEKSGVSPVFSQFIYEKKGCYSGSARERANALMDFYIDDSIGAIFDISGGDIANEILEYLDYNVISKSNKMFWGYSDLTTVINAIYTKSGCKSVLYQIKNIVWDNTKKEKTDLFNFQYCFVQGNSMKGIVVGGNIRCFLKLAGTEYFPDMAGKVLLLEALGGEVPQMITYLNQLKQIGVFEKINGILLGTFTTMEISNCKPDIVELVKEYAGQNMPIAKTSQIGHGKDSKAIIIGEKISLNGLF